MVAGPQQWIPESKPPPPPGSTLNAISQCDRQDAHWTDTRLWSLPATRTASKL